ncbi:type 1 fimbrial protein [Salmonella enterica]|nr:type 1 fimbrial protein [Salmonella enterica]EJS5648190.1 type 1 fimbrial protein [Salmonella enterica]ELG8872764.1 type 1 fimbrial protein [Salmonella enterica subsp. enterica serovar Saintpaul]
MKKNIIAIILASVCGLSATAANAADGTITFNGQITDTTCDVALSSPGATGGQSMVVELGSFLKSKIVSASDIVSERDIAFNLTNCPAAITKVGVKLEGTADADMTDAFANSLTTDASTGVAVKLMDGANVIKPNTDTAMKDITSGAADLQYKAQFIATKAVADVVSGKYSSVVNYTMNYQ